MSKNLTIDRVTIPVEAGHTPQLYLGHLNIPPQFCTYEVWPPWFWWDSVAPEPRLAENLTPMGNSQTSSSTPLTGVERG